MCSLHYSARWVSSELRYEPVALRTYRERAVPPRRTTLCSIREEAIVVADRALIHIAYARVGYAKSYQLSTKRCAQIDMALIETARLPELSDEKIVDLFARLEAFAMNVGADVDIGSSDKLLL